MTSAAARAAVFVVVTALAACGGGDTGVDAGLDASVDSGHDATADSGRDASADAGGDAGFDAELPTCASLDVDPASISTLADFVAAEQRVACSEARDCGWRGRCDLRAAPVPWPADAVLDVARARECIRATLAVGCALGVTDWLPRACGLAVRYAAQHPDGAPCGRDDECTSGICRIRHGEPCGGFCASPAPVGAGCIVDEECADGISCFGYACTAQVPAGAPCAAAPCAPGLACVGGLCGPPPADGEPCDRVCATGLECDWVDLTCRRLLAAGERCPLTSPDRCGPGLWCDDTDTCVAVTMHHAAPGCRCSADVDCLSGRCLGGACTLPPLVGEPCDARFVEPCSTGACAGGTCARIEDGGTGCSGDVDCEPGLACHGGALGALTRCAPPAQLGEDCAHAACADGLSCPTSAPQLCATCPTGWDAAIGPWVDPDAGPSDAGAD